MSDGPLPTSPCSPLKPSESSSAPLQRHFYLLQLFFTSLNSPSLLSTFQLLSYHSFPLQDLSHFLASSFLALIRFLLSPFSPSPCSYVTLCSSSTSLPTCSLLSPFLTPKHTNTISSFIRLTLRQNPTPFTSSQPLHSIPTPLSPPKSLLTLIPHP